MADKQQTTTTEKTEKRGFGAKGGKRQPQRRDKGADAGWKPVTKLGRLVQGGKINSLEEIYRFSVPIKESEIVDHFLKDKLKEEVMQIFPVQKQTTAGQRTRFKAFVVIGDQEHHLGLGAKCAKDVQGAIKGAIIDAKLNIVPVRQGYYGNKIGKAHTVPVKVTGKGGSVRVRLVPAPRGTGIVGAPTSKRLIQFAGIKDCYTSSRGKTRTKGNFLKATFQALTNTYLYLTPDLWGATSQEQHPFDAHNKFLSFQGKKH